MKNLFQHRRCLSTRWLETIGLQFKKDYKYFMFLFRMDVALLRLSSSSSVTPACLLPVTFTDTLYLNCSVIGHGHTSGSKFLISLFEII